MGKFRAEFFDKSRLLELGWKEGDSVDGQGLKDWSSLRVKLIGERYMNLFVKTYCTLGFYELTQRS